MSICEWIQTIFFATSHTIKCYYKTSENYFNQVKNLFTVHSQFLHNFEIIFRMQWHISKLGHRRLSKDEKKNINHSFPMLEQSKHSSNNKQLIKFPWIASRRIIASHHSVASPTSLKVKCDPFCSQMWISY